MNSSIAVIGANFGDEGKGQMTDALVRRVQERSGKIPLVSRFNGGAQAGHTVVTKDARHVFGHIGSGAFAGAATYLGSKFLVNPLALHAELSQCPVKEPKIYFGQRNRMSTVFDMALNAITELLRTDRHGSCAFGINETVTREDAGFLFNPNLLFRSDVSNIAQKLRVLRHVWVPLRLEELGLPNIQTLTSMAQENAALTGPMSVLYENSFDFEEHAKELIQISQGALTNKAPMADKVIFEGAQGLALDENLGEFPHVTRSITGLPFVVLTAIELAVKEITPVYVTRSYLTRHGAGKLDYEDQDFCDVKPVDVTNVHNEWQGSLRFAPLNLPMMKDLIAKDLARADLGSTVYGIQIHKPVLAVTCLDQIVGNVSIIDLDQSKKCLNIKDLPAYLSQQLDIDLGAVSHGPGAEHVEFLKIV